MKYKLEAEYKSLDPFEIELPNFVILTGINGVGKTQILQSLENGHSNIVIDGVSTPPNKIKYIEKLMPVSDLNPIHRNYDNYRHHHEEDPLFIGYFRIFEFQDQHQKLPENLEELEKFTNSTYGNPNLSTKQFQKLKSFIENSPERITDPKLLKESIPHGYHPTTHDIFAQNFSTIFDNYQKLEFQNLWSEFLKKCKGKDVSYLTTDEFTQAYGYSPWQIINDILKSASMDYEFKVPEDYDPNITYESKFLKKDTKTEVKISELSSGEKILIALAFALYNNDHVTQLPKILLLDETDASLHPSMSKQYLHILKNVFVKDLGIKVIITTHSPSTVALADEQDIFVVENSEQRIRKCSKDEALSVLTAGVPSFSVNYENRKQVFLESHYDVMYYERIYDILNTNNDLKKEISLNFISSGDSRTDKNGDPVANCSQVIHITNTMRKFGNKSCFGIIDWDMTNSDEDGLFVHALNEQYSIENCLLNPLYLGLLILSTKTGSHSEIDHSFRNLDQFNQNTLNNIHNWILEKIHSQFDTSNTNTTAITLNNGLVINTPQWFTNHQGHELEEKILKKIPELNALKRRKEEALKLEIIHKVFEDLPELIPLSIKTTFQRIQNS
ncbi:AAA family ATPase [Acinetobacter sp. ANC 4173]|uniref:AAA family ATPase n=1 Tax=Acinetobacter sp. ANC 4173 TaxID=2529837 RepID=UPI00103E51B8|nr:ATP-binding protein [Acinetobacter sp. ANC 4173]TCB82200.1 ATP-binding protein [Acinetobacter sp. ANC 4173]